jgi:hypothetical protein
MFKFKCKRLGGMTIKRNIGWVLLIVLLTSCSIVAPPPKRLPQLNEHPITGEGQYTLPQWSPDGKYLAFIANRFRSDDLVLYEVKTQRSL